MLKNWTISCHKCGNNHAILKRDHNEIVVDCPCGMKEDVAAIVAERD